MRRLWPISPDAQPRASAQPAKPSLLVRLDRLNTLRAISIIGVFLFHVFSTVFDRSVSSVDRIVANSDVSLQGTEKLGLLLLSQVPRLVTIFFLISGYFVHRTFLLWIRRNHSYLAFTRFFIWRRFWRLVPPFWVALLLSYAFTYKNPLAWASIRKLLVNATLFKTLVPGYFFSVNYAHWYVAVQWQLDLLYPVFIYIIWRYSGRAALITATVLALLTNFVLPHFSNQPYIYNLPFRWCMEWALGAYLAVAHAKKKRVFTHPGWAAAALSAGLIVSGIFNIGVAIWFLAQLSLVLFLECFLLSKSAPYRIERWIAPIGLWSYSLYLFHVPIIGMCLRFLDQNGFSHASVVKYLLLTSGAFVISTAVACLSYLGIEEPSSRLGSRCWCVVQRLRNSRRAPLFLVRPNVRQARQEASVKTPV